MSKVVLITGSTDGLGKEIAKELIKDYTVIINSAERNNVESICEELNCDGEAFDVTDFFQIKKGINNILVRHKKIDIVVNNAGIWIQGKLIDNEAEQIEKVLKVNSLGPILVSKAFLEICLDNSQIINIISQAGISYKAERSVYNASKWAITGFAKSLQEEVTARKIKISNIYPGLINTKMFSKAGIERDMSKAIDPKEIAGMIRNVIEFAKGDNYIPDLGIKNINY